MSKTRVVHINDNVPGAVYIGRAMPGRRGSEWRNPFKVGTHGDRAEVIEKYRNLMRELLTNDGTPNVKRLWREGLAELAGKPLACWCRHDGQSITDDTACHGDVLVALIEELGLEQEAKS